MKYWRKPLDLEKQHVPHGRVHVIDERCKGCGICVEFCPTGVLALSGHYNSKGYHPPRPIHMESCVNCGLCDLLCPEFAIYSVRVNGTSPQKVETPEEVKAAKPAKEAPSHA